MAPNAGAEVLLRDFDVRIVGMRLAWPMTGFTRKTLMLVLEQFVHFIGVALFACFLSGKNRLTRLQFSDRLAAIPAILPERWRSEKISRDRIACYDAHCQQQQPQHLWWHFESFHVQQD